MPKWKENTFMEKGYRKKLSCNRELMYKPKKALVLLNLD